MVRPLVQRRSDARPARSRLFPFRPRRVRAAARFSDLRRSSALRVAGVVPARTSAPPTQQPTARRGPDPPVLACLAHRRRAASRPGRRSLQLGLHSRAHSNDRGPALRPRVAMRTGVGKRSRVAVHRDRTSELQTLRWRPPGGDPLNQTCRPSSRHIPPRRPVVDPRRPLPLPNTRARCCSSPMPPSYPQCRLRL